MARKPRSQSMDPREIQVFHTISRCVRRAFLCGTDPQSGSCFDHRKVWIRQRLEFLASIFAVDLLTYTVMSNHLHLVQRSRPDVAAAWSDQEVALRWWRLCPGRKDQNGLAAEPTAEELNLLLSDPNRIAELRLRLSDISWWMGMLKQTVAVKANAEDGCTGRFWEGRFKAQALLDEGSILACAMYVDLNPIRAALAQTPETSEFTGAKDRIDDVKAAEVTSSDFSKPVGKSSLVHQWERSGAGRQSGWMSPIEIDEAHDSIGADLAVGAAGETRRASSKGFLNLGLREYLELLDWTGRSLIAGKRGAIPANLAPLLQRVGIVGSAWCDLVQQFGRMFKRAAGSPQSLAAEAKSRGQNYLHGNSTAFLSAG